MIGCIVTEEAHPLPDCHQPGCVVISDHHDHNSTESLQNRHQKYQFYSNPRNRSGDLSSAGCAGAYGSRATFFRRVLAVSSPKRVEKETPKGTMSLQTTPPEQLPIRYLSVMNLRNLLQRDIPRVGRIDAASPRRNHLSGAARLRHAVPERERTRGPQAPTSPPT